MTCTRPIATTPAERFALSRRARIGAIFALLGFPLWIVCFVLLYGALPEKVQGTPAQIISYYQSGGSAIWGFAIASLLAVASMLAGVVLLVRASEGRARVLGGATIALAVLGGIAFTGNWIGTVGMLTTDLAQPADWVTALVEGSTANQVLNGIAYSLLGGSATLLAFVLRSAGLLHRIGLVLGIMGIVLTVAMLALFFFVPMVAAVLEFALGLCLLLRRK